MDKALVNPIEDQRKEALRHYDEAARLANHWSSFVRDAILAYNPTTMDKQDKTADTVRPINIKIFVSQHFAGLREFIKDDEIAEFYEELIVDTVLAFSAQHRTAELEAQDQSP